MNLNSINKLIKSSILFQYLPDMKKGYCLICQIRKLIPMEYRGRGGWV